MLNHISLRSNVTSLQAQRHQQSATASRATSSERLSSGLRINRAADDAAGRAISETLAAQVRGLSQAARNAQDSINLIRTADGALAETTAILQRMRELVVQAGNDTYTQADRARIQEEVDQLKLELTRIAKETHFNGRTLLDGSLARSRFSYPEGAYLVENPIVGEGADAAPWVQGFEVLFINPGTVVEWSMTIVPGNGGGIYPNIGFTLADTAGWTNGASTYNQTHRNWTQDFTNQMGSGWGVRVTYGGSVVVTADIGKSFKLRLDPTYGPNTVDRGITMQVGSDEGQTVVINIQDYSAFGLQLEGLSIVGGTEAESHGRIGQALHAIDKALGRVNAERAELGAIENRIQHTLGKLGNSEKQQTISRSRITDADFAKETAAQTRSQVLQDATIFLLVQANTLPEIALKLLDQA